MRSVAVPPCGGRPALQPDPSGPAHRGGAGRLSKRSWKEPCCLGALFRPSASQAWFFFFGSSRSSNVPCLIESRIKAPLCRLLSATAQPLGVNPFLNGSTSILHQEHACPTKPLTNTTLRLCPVSQSPLLEHQVSIRVCCRLGACRAKQGLLPLPCGHSTLWALGEASSWGLWERCCNHTQLLPWLKREARGRSQW